MKITELTIKIRIPALLEQLIVGFVLLYRRLRFGCSFRRIPLTKGKFAIVDPADYPHLAKYKWRVCAGKNTFYAERGLRKSERTADGSARYLALRLVRRSFSEVGSPKGEAGSRILMHRQIMSFSALSEAESSGKRQSCLSFPRRRESSIVHRESSIEYPASLVSHIGDGLVIDHINRNGLDNRRANLRPATIAQNAQNSRMRRNRSGYKGVWFAKDKGRFRAAIWHNNNRIYLGYFNSPIDAARTYDAAARKYHGQFAALNFPD